MFFKRQKKRSFFEEEAEEHVKDCEEHFLEFIAENASLLGHHKNRR